MTIKIYLAFAAMLIGAAPVAAAETITVALNADIRSSDPGVNRDDNTDGVILNVVEGLVGYRENGTVAPLLAKSFDVSADNLTYTFHLRDGVKFHNGETMTSADVLWSWNRYMDPKTEWRCMTELDGSAGLKVESVSAPDPATFVMVINKPYALFVNTLARTDCGMTAVLSKDSVKADGTWDKPIGTGPFKFAEWKQGEYVLLSKFDDYVSPPGDVSDGYVGAKQPLIDGAKMLVVPDAASVKAALQSGAIDATQILGSDVVELRNDPNINVVTNGTAAKNSMIMQTRDPVLSNVKIRQAIAAAVDFDQLVSAVSYDLAKPNNSAIFPTSVYYDENQKQRFTYDPDKARQLLAEAGYKGEPLTIIANKRVQVPSYPAALIIQAMLQEVGMNVQIEVLEWPTQLDRYNKGNFQLMSTTYSSQLDPAQSYQQFMGPKDTQPRKVWDDPTAEALLQKALVTSDQAERQKLFDELHALQIEQAPLLIMYTDLDFYAHSKRIEGFSYWHGKPRIWETKIVTP